MATLSRAEKRAERQVQLARIEASIARSRAIVDRGTCPDCGTGLIRNLALAGWWQCGAYAAESHRQAQYRGLPKCHFQAFTE